MNVNPAVSNARMLRSRAAFILFALFLLLVILTGGASRGDAYSQLIARLGALLCGSACILLASRNSLRTYRALLAFLIAFAFLLLLQLVPLPPEIWVNMPGREPLARAAALAGIDQPWRPISITPDLTVNSLLSILPPLAAILSFSVVDRKHWRWVVAVLSLCILASGVLGLAQVSGRLDWLYLYRITNDGTAVGLFANRNHQALFLSMIFPFAAAIACFPDVQSDRRQTIRFVLAAVCVFFLPLILITGSRAGLVLSLIGMAGGALLYFSSAEEAVKLGRRPSLRQQRWLWAAGLAAAVLLIFVTINLSKAEAIQRIFSQEIDQEKRYLLFWPMVDMAKIYFPAGSGFGSFPDVFRIHEPFSNLSLTYMNHAHNDLLELVIEGGLAGLLLMISFLAWVVWRTYSVWTARMMDKGRHLLLGRLGSIIILMILLASLADYPIRTPTIAVVFALSCCWLCLQPSVRTGDAAVLAI